ncbi:hypothetical protein J2Z69_003080 [Paenibacillus shirakamiensis]|uniref:TATA-box binding protein n=1 Tax=Paenibacillus shirakamiensis TaxID=1265935 RepID=A0ABS4JK11_9BACL|nr:YwmB family TATA-box binding protein [Paenibacillus shirakamiensis]MBP2002023.1 hypothetical protein [Paenibacillus shirakamiensis]
MKRWMMIMSLMGLLMLGVVGFVKGNPAAAVHQDIQIKAAHEQLQSILKLGQSVKSSSLHTIIKWQGIWRTSKTLSEASGLLTSQLYMSAPVKIQVQDHEVYRSEQVHGPVSLKISVMQAAVGQVYVIVQVESANREGNEQLSILQQQTGVVLNQLGIAANWNGAVQGHSSSLSKNVNVAVQQLEKKASSFIQLQEQERFQDDSTASISYDAPHFPISVQGAHGSIGIQLAIHFNMETGEQEFSIGSPLLTVEY